MSYIEDLRNEFPELNQISDDQLISILPRLEPEQFGSLSQEQLVYAATNNDSQFTKGVKAGVDQIQAMGAGAAAALGDLAGATDLKSWGIGTYQKNTAEAGQYAPNVEGFTEIEGVEDALDWAGYTLGNLVPTMATAIAGGGIGGLVGKQVAKKAAAEIMAKELAKGTAKDVAAKLAGKAIAQRVAAGQGIGAFGASAGMETGSIYGETEDAGVSLAHGAIAGAFDALPVARILGKFGIAGAAKEQVKRSVAGELLKQGGFEAGTEALQTLVEQHAKHWVETNGKSLLVNLGEVNTKEIINAAAAGALGGGAMGGAAGLITRNPMANADEKIRQAGEQAAAQGGDILDQSLAQAEVQSKVTPEAVGETRARQAQVQTAEDLGVTFEQYETPLVDEQHSSRDMSGIDGLIIAAERMGFDEESARLRNAKKLYERADGFRNRGEHDFANRLFQNANKIYRDVTEASEPLKQEAANYPVAYVAQGEVLGGDVVPTAPHPEGSVYDQAPSPAGVGNPTQRITAQGPVNRLEDGKIIYGDIPADVRAAKAQAEANTFGALYGQEGQTPYAPSAIEGELDRSGELPDNRVKQLPPGTGQINMPYMAPEAEPLNPLYEGVGESIVKRQAPGTALPQPGISQEQMIDIQQQAREPAQDMAGVPLNSEWTAFSNETGTKGVPRAEMPQIKAEHRGAMTNFMNARGVSHQQMELPANSLKPTQAEFSPEKVRKAMEYEGGDRSILVSSDNFVLDGHHQWLAKREVGAPIKVIRLNAPIDELIPLAREFPSSEAAGGITQVSTSTLAESETQADLSLKDEAQGSDQAKRILHPEKVTTPPNEQERQAQSAIDLDDFGQKLGRARKDEMPAVRERLDNMDDDAIAASSLSKIWPKAEIDGIEDTGQAAVAFVARDLIPAKPRKKYRLQRWVESVRSARDMLVMLDESGASVERFLEHLRKSKSRQLGAIANRIELLTMLDRTNWSRIGEVQVIEANESIGTEDQIWVRIDYRSHPFKGAAELDQILDQVNEKLGESAVNLKMKFEIRSTRGEYFINKTGDKEQRRLKTFDELGAARKYLRNHHEALVSEWERVKERDNVKKADVRSKENRPRTGQDYRQGKDITVDEFQDAFGFRGVEFGNWVKQGAGGKERQGMLNQAYDALMDLAGILDVPSQAISLEGRLGLGFGSRGKGGASAHYEPDLLVINLTKTKGAGALAHEWFHALDNYFAHKRGGVDLSDQTADGYRKNNYVTYKPEQLLIHKDHRQYKMSAADLKRRREQHPDSGYLDPKNWIPDPDHKAGVRPVVEKAFANLVEVLNQSPMKQRAEVIDKGKVDGYWSRIIERGARAFENYVITKMDQSGFDNDYLANVISEDKFPRDSGRYPYLKNEEIEPVERAFDELFSTLESKETESGVALFSRSAGHGADNSTVLTVDATEAVARRIAARLRLSDGVGIRVVATEADLPAAILEQAAEHGAEGEVHAVLHKGDIFLVADRMADETAVETAILHESAHYGGRAAFGKNITKAYRKVMLGLGGINGMKAKAKELGFYEDMQPYFETAAGYAASQGEPYLVDEFLSHANQQRTDEKLGAKVKRILNEFYGAIRDMLRRYNFKSLEKLTNADIAFLLKQINKAAREGDGKVDTPHFMRVTDGDELAMFFADLAEGIEEGDSHIEDAPAFSRKAAPDNESGFAAPDETLKRQAMSWLADKFHVLKQLQQNIKDAGGKINETSDAYLAEELFHGKAENDLRLMRENFVEPLAKKMAEFGITQKALDEYLYALHAPERNAHIAEINPDMPDGGSGMTNLEAAEVVAKVNASGKQDKFDQVAAIVYDMLAARRDAISNGGLEEGGMIDAWEETYKHYVPLKGYADNEQDDTLPRSGKGFTIGGKESKRAMGRQSEAASPSSYAIQDLTETLVRKRKNQVGNAFLELVENNPNPGYWEVFTDENPEMDRRIVKRKDAEGEVYEEVVEQPIPMAMMQDRYFTTKRDGITHYIKLEDPRLMKAMKNLGPDTSNFIIQGLAKVSRFLSAVNTSYNPEFVIGNFARDIQTAILNLQAEQSAADGKAKGEKVAAKTVQDVPAAMRAIYRSLRGKEKGSEWSNWFDEFREQGGKTGYFDMKDIDGQAEDVQNLVDIAQGGFKGSFFKWTRASAQLVEDINQSVENAVRLSAYVNARKAGVSKAQAASLAKNMTVNFNRKGEAGTTLNALYMFANASIQGTMNFARTMGSMKGQPGDPVWERLNTAQKISIGLMAGSYALSMANRNGAGEDDDGENWYDKVPQYVKERNLVIMKSLLGGEQDGSYWKIPLPYGYNIFHVVGSSTEAVTSGSTGPGQGAVDLTLAALGSFSPIGFQDSNTATGTVLKNIAPTLTKPIVDVVANENFMGGSIYNDNFPFGTPKPDSSLARRSTPEGYRVIAEFLNEVSGGSKYRSGAIDINPDVMRYFVDYFAGGAGKFAFSKMPDNAFKLMNDVELPAHRTVFLSRINGQVLPYEDQTKFYDRRDEVDQIKAELESLKGGDRQAFYRENYKLLKLKPLIKQTEKRLKWLRKQRNAVYAADLNPAERDEKLKRIELEMKQAVDRFNKAYSKASS